MDISEVDKKYLGLFASKFQLSNPLLAQNLLQIFGILTILSAKVTRARKQRRLDTTRNTKSVDLYSRIVWYAREGLKILEEYISPMVVNYGELRVLSFKLRASFYHLYVLFHNQPAISLRSSLELTSPCMTTTNTVNDKGKGKGKDNQDDYNTSHKLIHSNSLQSTHEIERGYFSGCTKSNPIFQEYTDLGSNFLIPADDYRPIALRCFEEAVLLADRHLYGSHPLRLSLMVEYTRYLFDCLHDWERSRNLANATVRNVYESQEGMDLKTFEDAAQLVEILSNMSKRRGLDECDEDKLMTTP